MRQREKEEILKEETEYEERMRHRRMKERERAYKQVCTVGCCAWPSVL